MRRALTLALHVEKSERGWVEMKKRVSAKCEKNIWRKKLWMCHQHQAANQPNWVLTGILAGADSIDVCIASIAHVGDLWKVAKGSKLSPWLGCGICTRVPEEASCFLFVVDMAFLSAASAPVLGSRGVFGEAFDFLLFDEVVDGDEDGGSWAAFLFPLVAWADDDCLLLVNTGWGGANKSIMLSSDEEEVVDWGDVSPIIDLAFLSFFDDGALADANVCRRVDLVTTGNATRPCGTGALGRFVDWLVVAPSFDPFRWIGDSPGLGMSFVWDDFFEDIDDDDDDDDDNDDNCSVSIVLSNSADFFAATTLSSDEDLATFDLGNKSCSACSFVPVDVTTTLPPLSPPLAEDLWSRPPLWAWITVTMEPVLLLLCILLVAIGRVYSPPRWQAFVLWMAQPLRAFSQWVFECNQNEGAGKCLLPPTWAKRWGGRENPTHSNAHFSCKSWFAAALYMWN